MKAIFNEAKNGAIDGGLLYGATKAFQVVDQIAANFTAPTVAGQPPMISANVRRPLVALAFGLIGKKILPARMAGLAIAVAFKEVWTGFVDEPVNKVLAPVASIGLRPMTAPTPAATQGITRGVIGGSMHGITRGVTRSGTRGMSLGTF